MAISRAFLNSQRYDEAKGSINNTYTSPIIINGDMNVTQRGDQTGVTAEKYTTADRFVINISSLGTWSFSSSTDTPGFGFSKSLKIDCTTADGSPASSDNMYLTQLIEGQNLQMMRKGTASAKTSTVAYWIKSNKTGNYVVELWDRTNDRHVGKVATISQANTWEKHICNFPADTSGALANTNARSIMMSWAFDAGSNFTSGTLPSVWGSRSDANRFVGTTLALGDSTDNEVLITGVQFEMGTYDSETMPPFQFEDATTSLLRCQRYTQVFGGNNTKETFGQGSCQTATVQAVVIKHNTTMRTTPSISVSAVGDFQVTSASAFAEAATSISINTTNSGTTMAYVTLNTASNANSTLGRVAQIRAGDTTDARFIISAEL